MFLGEHCGHNGQVAECRQPNALGYIVELIIDIFMTGVRIDKWLWAARFFKSRALATRACELGRIQSNGQPAKPAREVHAGDLLQIQSEAGDFQIEVLLLSEVRGPATVAQTLYKETEASRELRMKLIEERKAMKIFTPAPEGRPSKRDRRRIIQFRSQRRDG